jgi:hypothetical protein
MAQAPLNATFVWCNNHLDYPVTLARNIGRRDLLIISPKAVEGGALREVTAYVVVDHAATLSKEVVMQVCMANNRWLASK